MANCISHSSFKPFASREVVERKLRHNRETDRRREGREARIQRPLRLAPLLLAVLSNILYPDEQKTYKYRRST